MMAAVVMRMMAMTMRWGARLGWRREAAGVVGSDRGADSQAGRPTHALTCCVHALLHLPRVCQQGGLLFGDEDDEQQQLGSSEGGDDDAAAAAAADSDMSEEEDEDEEELELDEAHHK
jgi:hypothetical protein